MADHRYPHPADDQGDHTPLVESAMTSPDQPEPARRRRVPAWLVPTVAALVVGVLLGAFFFGGTDRVTPPSAAAVAPTETSGAPVPRTVTALNRSEPVQIDLPSLGVSSSLVDLGLNGDGTLEVPVDYSKAGWFTGGNHPGDPQGPPALIAGHVDDFNGPAVFYELRNLAVGDEVMVVRADNTVAVFTVTTSQQYAKNAFPAEQVYAPVAASELVLITCTGTFDESARSYQDNLVVRARLDEERSLEESDKRVAAGLTPPPGDQPNV